MRRDGHVRLLPIHVANKIAAGEVVERPASVLKELMENAIDAGATRIDVTVTAGGRNLVSVRDDEAGTRLAVNAGVLAEVGDCGAPPGTCVEVRDLFCNVPARRKFLRAYATEEAHIRATFTVHALAHPDIGFSLSLDGRETYRFAPGATLEERIRDLFGASFAETLLPVDFKPADDASDVSVHGYIERPSSGAAVRREQFVFVNGRPATAAAISYAIREACPRSRDDARPALVLFIDLPPTQVDVNVHPAKREVRFRRPADVREAIIHAITNATSAPANGVCPPANGDCPPPAAPQIPPFMSAPVQPTFQLPRTPPPHDGDSPHGNDGDSPPNGVCPPNGDCPPAADSGDSPRGNGDSPQTEASPLWRWFKFLAQTSTGYLLLETDAGIVVMDPRAARERIAYERTLSRRESASQPLLIPETAQLPPADSARIRSFLPELSALGFVIEEFGRDTWKVDAVPDLISGCDAGSMLASIASDIAEGGARRGAERWREELVAKAVARSYAGASAQLTPEAATALVEELASARMPYVSPDGRPVMIYRSNREIGRSFGR